MRSRRYYAVRGMVRFFFYLAVLLAVVVLMAMFAYIVNANIGN